MMEVFITNREMLVMKRAKKPTDGKNVTTAELHSFVEYSIVGVKPRVCTSFLHEYEIRKKPLQSKHTI